MRWTWDPNKARTNLRDHKVPFALAEVALADPHLATQPDPHPDGDRWNTLAEVEGVLLFIVNTWPDEDVPDPVGRIISARRATSHERRAYENEGF